MVKALVALVPATLLVAGSSRMLVQRTTAFSLLQLDRPAHCQTQTTNSDAQTPAPVPQTHLEQDFCGGLTGVEPIGARTSSRPRVSPPPDRSSQATRTRLQPRMSPMDRQCSTVRRQ